MKMAEIIKNFAVFEGADGSGTSTQLSLLEKHLADQSPPRPVFYSTFEPTDGPIGKLLRCALKKELSLRPETIARLFAADRTEHLYSIGGITERCQRNELVISDRYALSSLVYQGIECGDVLAHDLNSSFPLPELLIFFDIDSEIALKRLKNRPALEIYEYLEFQQKVREKYISLLDEYRQSGVQVQLIDASGEPQEIAAEVWRHVSKMPIFFSEQLAVNKEQ